MISSKRIADASAIAVLGTFLMQWIAFRGLGGLFSSGLTGLGVMSNFPLLLFTLVGGIVTLLVLIYSETNPMDYKANLKKYAKIRLVCVVVGIIPVFLVMMFVSSYNPMAPLANQNASLESIFTALVGAMIPVELDAGIWLHLIAWLVVAVEAFIELTRADSAGINVMR